MAKKTINYNNKRKTEKQVTPDSEKMDVTPFQIKDCAIITRTSNGLPAMNLREFRERVGTVPLDSVYHHFCETVLRPSFDDPEFHNDFAIWARRALHDHVLAERLEILDPFEYPNLEEFRKVIIDILDDRLSEVAYIPWVTENRTFHFLRATTVVFDTGNTIESPERLSRAIAEMTTSSIYYHFWEARRRTEEGLDDFSTWLKQWNSRGEKIIDALARVDFYFLSLRELQDKLVKVTHASIEGKY